MSRTWVVWVAMIAALAMMAAACGDGAAESGDDGGDIADDDGAVATDDGADDDGADDSADDDSADDDGADDDGDDGADDDGTDDDGAASGELVDVEVLVFAPPSLGAFLPAVIADQRFDQDNGLEISFVERPSDAYNIEFGAGQFQVGGSASLMSEGNRILQGVDIVYLFNVHDYWGGLVSTTPDVTSLEDIEGATVAGATSSTSWAMFRWFVQAAGVDLDAASIENSAPAGLITLAQTGRADAVQLFEPGYTTLVSQGLEGITDIPLPLELWEEEFGSSDIPFLGVGAHRGWLEENEDIVPLLEATYRDAADWSLANPDEAGAIIAATIEGADDEALADLLRDNDRLGLNVRTASEVADGIRAVFEAGVDIDYFESLPSEDLIYEGTSQ